MMKVTAETSPRFQPGRNRPPMRLGERLVQEGHITPDQLQVALTEHRLTGKKIGEAIVSLGFM